jgi:N-acetylglucosamine malate deacetylase 1
MNVLAIGAHGDDLEMFCGGTLARFAERGDKVFMCVVTDGRGRPKGNPDEIAEIRRKEAQTSADVIGAESVWMGVPDGMLWFDEPTRHKFIEVIRETQPDIIITHPADDYHPDHKTTSRLVMDSAQIARTANYPSKFAPHRATVPIAFMDAERGIDFNPTEYVDISSVWEKKIAMLNAHRSQMMMNGYDPNFVVPPQEQNLFYHYASVLSGFRGLSVDARYAEGFRFWHVANRMVARRILP